MASGTVKIEYTPLTEIDRWPRNPKLHDVRQLSASVERFGFVQPFLVDEKTGRLVAGHGRLETLTSMKQRGTPPPEYVQVQGGDWLVPVVRGVAFESEQEAEAYLIADNRLQEIGGWDDKMLARMLAEASANVEGAQLTGLGFTDDQMRSLLEEVGLTDLLPPDEFPAFDDDIETSHQCPKCGYEWSGQTK